MGQDFFELVKAALPHDVNPQELLALAPQKWWREKPYVASAYALRKSPRIDWIAYLENNHDVKENGIDACLHFLRHGIHEGRKLSSRSYSEKLGAAGAPLVSVVIINYNNAHLLHKCLDSVVNQTLKDIEIIVVDDCSTDNSREIISEYALKDQRVKLIVNPVNSATFVARKRGVEAATGRYLMFLDSDDYMALNACEIAAKAIAKGYDLVKFGAHVVDSLNAPKEDILDADNFCNRGELGEYFNDEIITSIFREGKMGWHVWSFISLRVGSQKAFAELPDEYITGPDDLYAQLAMCRRSKSMLKIKDRLVYYNYGPGVSVTVDKAKVIKYAPARAGAIRAIKRYAEQHSLNVGLNHLYRNLCGDLLGKLLAAPSVDDDMANCMAELVDTLGFKPVIEALFQRFPHKKQQLAGVVRPTRIREKIRNIGILFPKLHYGGTEAVILAMCDILESTGYRVTLLLEERAERDPVFAARANLLYIGAFGADLPVFSRRLAATIDAVGASGIDVLIHASPNNQNLLWDMLTFQHHNIPVIPLQRFNLTRSFSSDRACNRNVQEAVFSRADAVICQSRLDELYLRLQGVNAVCISSPAPLYPSRPREAAKARIAVLGRLGDTLKQIGESLKVLRQVISRTPWVSMCLIGDFYSHAQLGKFRQMVREMGLEKLVTVTGWTEQPELFLQDCGVLLSVSATEAFPMNIAEAQALGLPCVIYDLPIDMAEDNPSIIRIPQGDYAAAAAEIVSLFENPEKWQRLSLTAFENSRKYVAERFASDMEYFFNNFQYSSPVRCYSTEDYKNVIRYASRYSGRIYDNVLAGK